MLSSPISTLTPPCYNFALSLHEGGNIPAKSDHLSKIIYASHDIEKHIYWLSLDAIDMNDAEQDRLFTMYSIDTVHSSYLAAQSRVRQYTQFVTLLQRTEDAWAQRFQEAGYVVVEQRLCKASLDGIEVEDDEQDVLLKCTVDTVLANYVAAQHRVRQYTQFLMILKSEEDAWAQRFRQACCAMPDYEPARSDRPSRADPTASEVLRI